MHSRGPTDDYHLTQPLMVNINIQSMNLRGKQFYLSTIFT